MINAILNGTLDDLAFGIGDSTDKFYGVSLYEKATDFTQEEIDSVLADPYQIFRTAEDELRDYGLKLTTASETLSMPMIGAYDVDVNYTDGTSVNRTGTGTLVENGATAAHIFSVTGSDSEGSIYYDCNQANSQGYVPELIQGKHGTLSGLPAPSGCVRELDSHGGVEFDGDLQAATGTWGASSGATVTFTTVLKSSGLTQAGSIFSASGNYGIFDFTLFLLTNGAYKRRVPVFQLAQQGYFLLIASGTQ